MHPPELDCPRDARGGSTTLRQEYAGTAHGPCGRPGVRLPQAGGRGPDHPITPTASRRAATR